MKTKAQQTIKAFLEAWKLSDYKKMYEYTQKTWKSEHTKNQLKKLLPKRIKSYRITSITESVPTVYDVDVVVSISGKSKKITARLICETEPYIASLQGEFGVNPISIIRNLY